MGRRGPTPQRASSAPVLDVGTLAALKPQKPVPVSMSRLVWDWRDDGAELVVVPAVTVVVVDDDRGAAPVGSFSSVLMVLTRKVCSSRGSESPAWPSW